MLAGYSEASEPLLSGGWMGSLTHLLLRTLLDVSVSVANTVVKLHAPHATASLACRHISLSTDGGDWRLDLQVDAVSSLLSYPYS